MNPSSFESVGVGRLKVTVFRAASYFLCPEMRMETAEEAERLATGERAKYVMACNGWVINNCSIKNFAEYDENAYLRREIVIWGDSVKLRSVVHTHSTTRKQKRLCEVSPTDVWRLHFRLSTTLPF